MAGWVWLAEDGGEQPLHLVDRERDEAGVSGRRLVRPDGRRRLGAGAVPEPGGGNSADGEGGHDEHEVAEDRGVEPGLALVQAEVVLSELESFFSRPLLMREEEIVSSASVASGAILSVGALLQAATTVGRLLAAAGDPDATGLQGDGDSGPADLGGGAARTAGAGGGAAGDARGAGGSRDGRAR